MNLVNEGIVDRSEGVALLFDIDPEWVPGFDVPPRLAQLYHELAVGHTDVKLLGFSEGAATIAVFLSELANNPQATAEKMGNTPVSELEAAVLLECPNSGWAYLGEYLPLILHTDVMNKLPDRLIDAKVNIRLADVWNEASMAHGGQVEGWGKMSYPYDSRPSHSGQWFYWLYGWMIELGNQGDYHTDVLTDSGVLNIIASTFYPGI